jgi:hypothetical protein
MDPEVERIVARMLEQDPARRYPTCASLIGDLHRAVGDLAPVKTNLSLSPTSSKKLVVKKKAPRVLVESRAAGLDTATEQKLESLRMNPLESRSRGRGKASLIVFVVFLLAVVIVATVATVMAVSGKREEERRERTVALALRKTVAEAEDLYGGISKTAASVAALDDRVIGMADKATNSVFVILGELIPAAPPPPAPPPQPADTNAPAVSTQTNAAPNAVTNAPAVVTQPDPTPVDDRPAIVLGRRVVNGTDAVRRGAAAAREMGERALALRDETAVARTAASAQTNVMALAAIAESLPPVQAAAEAALKDAEAALREITSLERKTVAQREEAEKQREIELQRQREEQALQDKIAAELKRMEELQSEAMNLLRKFRCREAFQMLGPEQASFTTAEGRASFGLLLERFKRLDGFKQFLIDGINARPFRWGWGTGPAAKDITGADENGITITGGKEPWDRMGIAHFVHLSKHYLSLPDVRSSVIGEQKLALAIYMWLGAQTEEAVRYRDQAIEAARYLETDARRLVPSL